MVQKLEENVINNITGWGDNIELVDIDHNGFIDILTTSHYLDALYNSIDKIILAKNTNGVFQVISIPASTAFYNTATGDLDNDGYVDFIAASVTSSDLIYWFKNMHDTAFVQKQSLGTKIVTNKTKIVDIDNVYADVSTQSTANLNFYKIKNLGNGTFNPRVLVSQNIVSNDVGFNWDITDIDGDGLLDISLINANMNSYLKNIGNFTFGTALTTFSFPASTYNGILVPIFLIILIPIQ